MIADDYIAINREQNEWTDERTNKRWKRTET